MKRDEKHEPLQSIADERKFIPHRIDASRESVFVAGGARTVTTAPRGNPGCPGCGGTHSVARTVLGSSSMQGVLRLAGPQTTPARAKHTSVMRVALAPSGSVARLQRTAHNTVVPGRTKRGHTAKPRIVPHRPGGRIVPLGGGSCTDLDPARFHCGRRVEIREDDWIKLNDILDDVATNHYPSVQPSTPHLDPRTGAPWPGINDGIRRVNALSWASEVAIYWAPTFDRLLASRYPDVAPRYSLPNGRTLGQWAFCATKAPVSLFGEPLLDQPALLPLPRAFFEEGCAGRLPERLYGLSDLVYRPPYAASPLPFLTVNVEARVEWARNRARRAIGAAYAALSGGRRALTDEQRDALDCWYPGITSVQYAELVALLAACRDALRPEAAGGIPIQYVSREAASAAAAYDSERERDLAIIVTRTAPARTVLEPPPTHINLYPMWEERSAYGATRIIHEIPHATDPANFGVEEHESAGFHNAFRFQGFVSQLDHVPYDRETVTTTVPEAARCARLG